MLRLLTIVDREKKYDKGKVMRSDAGGGDDAT